MTWTLMALSDHRQWPVVLPKCTDVNQRLLYRLLIHYDTLSTTVEKVNIFLLVLLVLMFSFCTCFIVILPQSALEQLSNYNIEYPMVFKLTNDRTGVSSHCGVLEFSAKEGVSYIPGWVSKNQK